MRREAMREYLRGALWAMPSVAVVAALVAGSVLSLITVPEGSVLAPLVFQGTPDDARNLLIGIASTMVTVIALVLGLTVVALQLASTQFSPRLLRNFLRDGVNQVTLSSFVATFAYSTAGLFTVGVSEGLRTTDYPRLAVSGALLLMFTSLLMLVFFVHHLAHSIQVDEVMRGVERATLRVIGTSLIEGEPGLVAPVRPPGAVAVGAASSGYVQTFHLAALGEVAAQHDVVVEVVPMIGEHVVAGAPVAWVWPAGAHRQPPPQQVADAVRSGIRLGFERTLEQDAAFGVRQLADIASKALSPAINDPYTAVQAVDHLSVMLAALAGRSLGHHAVRDAGGTLWVFVPGRDFEYFVDLAVGQVRRYGHGEPRVVHALYRVLRDIAWFCDAPRRTALVRFVTTLMEDVERTILQPADRDPLLAEGRALAAALAAPPTGAPL